MTSSLIATIDCRAQLGEGIVWDDRLQVALWVDIEGQRLFRSALPFNTFESFAAPHRIGSLALLEEGAEGDILVAFEQGFARFNYLSGDVQWLVRPSLPTGARFNDGRVDRTGKFWAGTMIEDTNLRHTEGGELYRLNGPDDAQSMLSGIQISNSLCWSPDGSFMFFADTPHRTIHRFEVSAGKPQNRTSFVTTETGAPDGSTIDSEGYLWNAEWGAGRAVRYRPDGSKDAEVSMPAPHTSCVAFGGPDLNLLFVTTARVEMSEDELSAFPKSGSVFVFKTAWTGLPENRCKIG